MNSKKSTVYKIVLRASAQKELKKLSKSTFLVIKEAINKLARQPRPPQSRKMVGGKNQWRLRVGDYRVVYAVIDEELIIEIVKVAHRREIYRK